MIIGKRGRRRRRKRRSFLTHGLDADGIGPGRQSSTQVSQDAGQLGRNSGAAQMVEQQDATRVAGGGKQR